MSPSQNHTQELTRDVIEARRMLLLETLEALNPIAIFKQLETSQTAVFTLSAAAALSIREGLADVRRRHNESSALARVKIAARTPDKSQFVYRLEHFRFETLGTADAVYTVERERLGVGEIEIHSHVFSRPEYLGQTDVGDLIAAIEGPAWISPPPQDANTAVRVFGILSVHANRLASLQFYLHDLRENLAREHNYGLRRFGLPIAIDNAY